MLKKILFPTDFSDASQKVKKQILKMKDCKIGKVILLNVVDARIFSYTTELDNIEIDNLNLIGPYTEAIKSKLESWQKQFVKAGIKVSIEISEGTPFNQILEFAENENITSIFIGHQGHNAVERMLIGSTTEKVVRKAKVPVIVIR